MILAGMSDDYRADKNVDGHTDTDTDLGDGNTRRPILASGKNELFIDQNIMV